MLSFTFCKKLAHLGRRMNKKIQLNQFYNPKSNNIYVIVKRNSKFGRIHCTKTNFSYFQPETEIILHYMVFLYIHTFIII